MTFPIVITARSKSSRLPEKAFRLLRPRESLLEYIINKAIDYVGKKNVYLATQSRV